MKQTNKGKLLAIYLIACMLTMYGFMPGRAQAASLVNVSDTISSSAKGAVASHLVTFMASSTALVATDKIIITLPAGFDATAAAVVQPANTTSAGFTGQALTLNVTGPIVVNTAINTTINNITSPSPVASTTSYKIHIETQTTGGVVKERADAMIVLVDSVTMSATVDATLAFTVSGLNAGINVNGIPTTATTTATTTPFGTLAINASSTVGQQLTVATNARDGYSVTVQENQELTSNHGANINSFDNSLDGVGSSTPHAWNAPVSNLDQYYTYGHMGITSDDATLSWGGGDPFGTALFGGLTATNTMTVMSHNGPSDGTTQDKGAAKVAYTIMVGPLQEAGDYQNVLTYVCTPSY